MSLNPTVLFGTPQQEVASLLRNRLASCQSASFVAGFLTVEGVAAIADPLKVAPGKLDRLVVGAGTYRSYEALDKLVNLGVPLNRLHVHLGHTRATTATAKHKFYRYHPMLHSKVYYLEMPDGTACAFIGSHNLTGFALLGLNGEASVLLEGDRNDPQFDTVRKHIQASAAQSVPYAPGMKEAYSWWTGQFLEGLRDKANDHPRDGEAKQTIVILARADRTSHPESGDKFYFEIPAALGRVQTTNAEVHLYMFAHLPSSPYTALYQLDQAFASLWCRVIGLEDDQGGSELDADWLIDDRKRTIPLRARPMTGAPVLGKGYGRQPYSMPAGSITSMR
jgi:HKD family nuclease